MKEKTHLLIIFFLASLLFFLINSCNKDERRITQKWKFEQLPPVINDCSKFTGYLELLEDGTYILEGTYCLNDDNGTWHFSNNNKELILITHSGYVDTWEILELKKNKFWFKEEDGREWRLVPF